MIKKDVLSLKHTFSPAERLQLSDDQSEKLGKIEALKSELKQVQLMHKADIEENEAAVRALTQKIRARYELRPVECMVLLDRVPNHVITIRLDTAHVARYRKMTDGEKREAIDAAQQTLPGVVPERDYVVELHVDDDSVADNSCTLRLDADEFEAIQFGDLKLVALLPSSISAGAGVIYQTTGEQQVKADEVIWPDATNDGRIDPEDGLTVVDPWAR
jgi:hypothetical protein